MRVSFEVLPSNRSERVTGSAGVESAAAADVIKLELKRGIK